MHTKRVLLSLILVAIGVALTVLVTASTTQAAPESTAASFGMLMKTGWGGTNGKMSDGNIAVLKCATQHTTAKTVRFPPSTYVYTNTQGISCAKVPLGVWVWPAGVTYDPLWEQPGSLLSVPIPNSWP